MKSTALALAAALCLALSAGLAAPALAQHTPPAAAAPGWPVEASDAAAQLEDLAAFETGFFQVDKAYSPSARAEAERRLAGLRAEAGKISNGAFALKLSQIVALADNGHSFMVNRGSSFGRAGLRLAVFGQDFYVLRATTDHADILGGRLVAVDGTPVAALRDAGRTLVGGIAPWRDRQAVSFLESPRQLHALGLTRAWDEATYRFEMPDGRMVEAKMATVAPPAAPARGSGGVIDPFAIDGWPTLLAPDKAPWGLRDFDRTFRWRDAPEWDAVVIQLHGVVDSKYQKINDFLAEVEAARVKAGRHNLVLDMRFNGGGNLQLIRDFLSGLPARLPAEGRIVVLTSPWTFSAAISSTGYLKQAGGERVVIVGEGVGDRLQFFAEGRVIDLPHSGAGVLFATERHDYLTGCKPFTDCHGPVAVHPIAVKTLAPDVPAPLTFEAYAAGRDPGMEAVAKVLGKAN